PSLSRFPFSRTTSLATSPHSLFTLFSSLLYPLLFFFFFFNDTAPTEIYTLSLHDALPICSSRPAGCLQNNLLHTPTRCPAFSRRSEEHTSELQSLTNLVCRLLLEKKKKQKKISHTIRISNTSSQ